jgi:predicted PurR-regulated permease PerM
LLCPGFLNSPHPSCRISCAPYSSCNLYRGIPRNLSAVVVVVVVFVVVVVIVVFVVVVVVVVVTSLWDYIEPAKWHQRCSWIRFGLVSKEVKQSILDIAREAYAAPCFQKCEARTYFRRK